MKNQFVVLIASLAIMVMFTGFSHSVNPVAWIDSLSPQYLGAGVSNDTLLVNGGNFMAYSVGRINGSNRPTIYISSTQLQVVVLDRDLADPGQAAVTVFNPAPGGGESLSRQLEVEYPAPAIMGLLPTDHLATPDSVTVTILGSNFFLGATAYLNGNACPTTFVNKSTIGVTIRGGNIATAGVFSFVVMNPSPSVGQSNQQFFGVTNAQPQIVRISPSSQPVGSLSFTLTVTGSDFVSATVVRFNNSACVTTFINSTTLTAVIPPVNLMTPGSYTVSVFSPHAYCDEAGSVLFSVTSSGCGHGKGRPKNHTASLQGNDGVEFSLNQNYPEPFNPTTIIGFDLPTSSTVTLIVYNMLGQQVAVLLNQEQLASGNRQVQFSASNLPSGTYIYRIEADAIGGNGLDGRMVDVKKMTLLK